MLQFRYHLLLLLTAAIWGFAFVAQRLGNAHIDPFLFNGLRFGMGALSVWLLALVKGRKELRFSRGGLLLGLVLFTASSLQQVGLIWTSAGAAGFITGLYIVFVPLIGIARKQAISSKLIVALLLSLGGLVLLNDFSDLKVSAANGLVLLGAFFWAVHVQYTDKCRQELDTLSLVINQYTVAAFGSLIVSLLLNRNNLGDPELLLRISRASWPLVYGGIFSVGIAFSLQAYAQKHVAPSPAALILCTEGVFALISGYLVLHEKIGLASILGAGLITGGMVLALLPGRKASRA